jgi:NAD(P)H-flavin reductase
MQALAEHPPRDPMAPAPWRVVARRVESADTVTLEMEPVAPGPFAFEPGQFNMLSAFGVGEVPISISGDPASTGPVVHTIRDVGAVTHALCELQPGGAVGLRGPFGTDWRVDEAAGRDVVVVAGGIGLPPLRPAIYRLLADREQFGRVVLLYGARTPADLLFPDEVTGWRGRFDLDVQVTVDSATEGWKGNVGVVPDLIARAQFDPSNTVAVIVGPEIMMRFAVRALLDAGVPAAGIRLSMERNMQCAIAMCGHCQLGPYLVCRDGPVFDFPAIAPWFGIREL